MKIVLDANIFVSSFFWGGNPRTVLNRAIKDMDTLYITKEIVDEIRDVVGRPKFHAGEEEINYYLGLIEETGNKVIPKNKIKNGSWDKTDNKYIECGIACGADYIISGDIHLLELKEYETIKIVTAAEYLEIIRGNLP
jgi:putative PIN family toxin of toxin-antitoxin system